MSSTKAQFIETTCDLLESQGYYATGLNQIVAESGAPKGSLYYHFPEGKEELAAEAIHQAGEKVADRIHAHLAGIADPAIAIRQFVERIADSVEASGYRTGGPLQTVAMETATTSERLNLACRKAYTRLRQAFAGKFEESGYDKAQAAEMAIFVISAIEGGVILSRTYHSGDPLRQVAQHLGGYLEQMATKEGAGG